MLRYARRSATLFALALTLAACDTVEEDEATVSATLDGGVEAERRGSATFSTIAAGDAPHLAVLLSADEDRSDVRGSVRFIFYAESLDDQGRPAEGTYAVGSTDGFEVGVGVWGFLGPFTVAVRGGTLTLAESSSERLSGAFALEGTTPWGEETMVAGTFTARSE